MLKRIIAVFSALCLVAGLIPLPAFATGDRRIAAADGSVENLAAATIENEAGYLATAVGNDANSPGNTFFVDGARGNDANEGTEDAPLKTIAHATSVMRPGDACYIRGGTYREFLSDHQRIDRNGNVKSPTIRKLMGTEAAPFTFQAYPGEKVTLTGCDPVTGWTQVEGAGSANIWQATMDWDMYLGKTLGSGTPLPEGQEEGIANGNLVFAGGKPCIEGRWPNAYAEAPTTAACGIPDSIMDLDRYARTDAGTGVVDSTLRIVDAGLATAEGAGTLPAGTDLAGAQVWCAGGEGYGSLVWLVNGHDKATGTLSLDMLKTAPSYSTPRTDNIFYVTRSLALLDQPGEWYKDVKNGQLYLCVGENEDPNNMLIEAKSRTYAIDFGESSYVTFRGIDVYGGIVTFMGNANHCTFTQAEVQATDACQGPTSSSTEWEQKSGFGCGLGIVLGGTFNAVTNCDFHDMCGEAVKLEGSDNFFVNNSVRRANMEHSSNSGGIQLSGKRHMVSHNSVTRVARLALGGGYEASEICYNDLSYAMRLSRDGGIIYCNVHDYEGSQIHHNRLHDSREGDGNRPAFYLDPLVENLTFHHNVIYGTEDNVFDNTWDSAFNTRKGVLKKSLTLSPFGLHVVIANNTFVNTFPISVTQGDKDPTPDFGGSLLANNLFRSAITEYHIWDLQRFGWTLANNLGGSQEPRADSSGTDGEYAFNFRTDDFADEEARDYTLKAGSEAIDGGIAIPGITDDVVDGVPDVGAFEHGQDAWGVGCDLEREFPLVAASTGGVPMSSVLTNGCFESYEGAHPWEASTNDFRLTGWTQSGDLTHYFNSSWNSYGEISGDGIYSVQMRSGSKLSQRVEGLKANTLYAIAGYGRVASDYILGNAAVAGWDRNGNALAAVEPQSKIGAARTLQFKDVDFGATGADRLVVGISGSGATPANAGLIVRARLDDRTDDAAVGELHCDQWRGYGGRHEWPTIVFDRVFTGVHDVYLEFDTSVLDQEREQGKTNKNPDKIGDGSLYGLFFANSKADDAVTITAKASGDEAELVYRESRFTHPQRHAYVRTGADGVVDVEVTKTGAAGSVLFGYADTLSLYEVLPALDEVSLPDAKLLERVAAQLDAQGVAYLREGRDALSMAGNDIARVQSLDLSGSGIESLEGIGSFTFLERVDVSGNHITDFSPLAGIKDLELIGESAQTPAPRSVTWKNYDGTVLASETVASGAMPKYGGPTPEKPADATATYTFARWSPNVTPVTGNATYTAQFKPTPRTYTITWKNGSTVLRTDTVTYGTAPSYDGAIPTKAATDERIYTFSGWSPSVATVTGDATYTAQFSSKQKVAHPAAVKKLVFNGSTLTGVTAGAGYTLSGTSKAKNAGTYKATAKLKSGYVWKDGSTRNATVTWSIAKAKQTLKAAKSNYSVKYAKVRKATRKISVKFTASGGGTCTWAAAKTAGGKISIAKNGKVTVKKGTPKSTYKLNVTVTAKAKGNYKKTTKTVVLKVRVK